MNFKKYHVSRNLLSEKYENRSINGVGAFVIDSDFDLWIGEVVAGQIYTISNMDAVYGFFTAKPLPNTGTTYNGSRGYERSGTAVVTVPSGCTWIAVRVSHNADNAMLNTGSQPLPYEPYSSEVWHDIPHYIHNTSTDTLTTLPAVIYANDTTATVGLKGQMEQSGTPSPTTPIQPSECGDLETEGTKAGQYKIPILSNSTTTNVYLGEVQTTRKIKKLVLKGTESWVTYGGNYFSSAIDSDSRQYRLCYCTHLESTFSSGIYVDSGGSRLKVFSASVSSVATTRNEWETYLQQQYANGTPVTVWYVLATPETGIVNEPLMKIGDYADEVSGITIPTIAGANTISIGTTLQPSEVSVNYKGWHPVADVHERESGAWD